MTKHEPLLPSSDSKDWPQEFFNLLLEQEQTSPCVLNSSSSSPAYDLCFDTSSLESCSPLSSPTSTPEYHCNLGDFPTTVNFADPSNLSVSQFINAQPYIPDDESLDAIILSLSPSDLEVPYDRNCPPAKKRKHSEMDTTSTSCSTVAGMDSITQQINFGKVFLSREQLLLLSSTEFDDYRKKLGSKYELSAEEKEMLKKQRRVIKNREYSQNSRQKKRLLVTELEVKLNKMEAENAALRSENQSLKQKLSKIVFAYKRANPVAPPPAPMPSLNTSSSLLDFFSISSPSLSTGKKATACLFIMLLSFGLLFSLNEDFTKLRSNGVSGSSHTGRIILNTGESNDWLSSFSSILNYYQSTPEEDDADTALRLTTTVITNIEKVPHNLVRQEVTDNAGKTNDVNWDDTHVCDYVGHTDRLLATRFTRNGTTIIETC